MKITKNLLKNFIDIPDDIDKLTNQYITEVEDYFLPFEINNLVIGHVLECQDHPNSDHLHITKVDVKDEILDIVCGAPNVKKGQFVIVAKEGAKLSDDFIIKKSTIRGVESNGMICSLKELGFDLKNIPLKYLDGIYYFEEDMSDFLGLDALEVLNIDGFVMELGITPNRSDLLSYLGYAYDLAAVTNKMVDLPKPKITESNVNNPLSIEIKTDGCKVYYGRHFTNIKVKESPWWLKSVLILNDIRPINNVVDISNYVLLEYGTPLHMFDAKKVKTNKIVVKDGFSNLEVVTLDEQRKVLKEEDIVVTDGVNPIAIGGVMGLLNTVIDESTTEVILEAAYFDKKRVKDTSKRLNLKSDSSLRFEKGIDIKRIKLALERASELLVTLADASVSKGVIKAGSDELKETKIKIKNDYFTKKLGTKIDENTLDDIFKRLNYSIKKENDFYILTLPSYRSDLLIDADILEEVSRLYGYDKLNKKELLSSSKGTLTKRQKDIRRLRHFLANNGLNETINYTLIKESDVQKFQSIGEVLKIMQPLTEDRNALRQSLVNGLIETLNYNQSRKIKDCSLFEIGNCYAYNKEELKLGILLSGSYLSRKLESVSIDASFYLLKGLLDKIAFEFNIDYKLEKSNSISALHPNKQAHIIYNGETIGFIGCLHPNELSRYDILDSVVLEINLDKILGANNEVKYQPVSKYPSIERDIAFIVLEESDLSAIEAMIRQTTKKYLVGLEIFDVYRDDKVGENKKSLAYSLTFNDSSKTLESSDIDKLMKSVANRLEHEFKAVIRKN
ncbi:phenylalanine--tRNA ligase subunit beta [Acholeplasma sp. OttesenSCG-928-E16]|nr:phenylalanine--tRNA ligase subunit beta [Acholeplasma sp. OttesenSCG-928-E16]